MVPEIVKIALELKIPVALNLSLDLNETRDGQIREFLNAHGGDPNLFVISFTNEVTQLPQYSDIKDRMIVLPKTIRTTPDIRTVPYVSRKGIFLGDIGKLSNPRLTDNPVPYLKAIKDILGDDVPLSCVQQYASSNINEEIKELVTVLPYADDVLNLFSRFRMYVHLQRYCTFEMLPMEAVSSGLPTAYIDMPQSLNEYIGNAGIHFTSPEELARKVNFVYKNEKAWSAYARAGTHRAIASDMHQLSGMMGVALIDMISRAKGGSV